MNTQQTADLCRSLMNKTTRLNAYDLTRWEADLPRTAEWVRGLRKAPTAKALRDRAINEVEWAMAPGAK